MSSYGLVLGAGGARAAYQAGVLQYLGDAFPASPPTILTATGGGTLNAGLLAGQEQSWPHATADLVELWTRLAPRDVFEPRPLWALVGQMVRHAPSAEQSLLDASPLRAHLKAWLNEEGGGGLRAAPWLDALAVTTTRYDTLHTITWAEGGALQDWSHDKRTARPGPLRLDHLMAAMALPLVYPAVPLANEWHGAGVGMLHPLAPALRLGADRILAIATRYEPSAPESNETRYPSPLQVASSLSNALLLDPLPADAAMASRINALARRLPEADRPGIEPTDVLVLRPSVSLTTVANSVDVDLGDTLGTVLQYLHGRSERLPDLLSMLLYAPPYLRRLLLIGYADARQQHDRIAAFLCA